MRSGETLSKRVARGGAIVGVSFVIEEIFRFARTLVLARMLSPTDFGLMGIAAIAISTLETFSGTGFDRALIQRKGSVEDYLDTAWVVSIARGILLTGMLYLLSPSVAAFFRNQEAIPVVRALSLVFLLDGLSNVGVVLFQKELAFGRDAVLRQTQVVAEFIVAVWLAFRLGDVWAIVYGMLAGRMIGLLVSYAIQPYRPRLIFEAQKARELFDFGRYVWGYTVIIFLVTQGDDALVGRVLGTAALGFYGLAYKISNFPATGITHVISQVTFPAYSKLQDDIPRLREAYFRTLQFTTLLSIPVAGGLLILAPEIVANVLGERWIPMVTTMQILCIFGALRSIGATFGPLFQSVRRPDLVGRFSCFQLVFMAMVIYPLATRWNILGVALAVVIPMIAAQVLQVREAVQVLQCAFRAFADLLVPVTGTIIMTVSVWLLKGSRGETMGIWDVFLLLFFGGLVYLVSACIFDRVYNRRVIRNVVQALRWVT